MAASRRSRSPAIPQVDGACLGKPSGGEAEEDVVASRPARAEPEVYAPPPLPSFLQTPEMGMF